MIHGSQSTMKYKRLSDKDIIYYIRHLHKIDSKKYVIIHQHYNPLRNVVEYRFCINGEKYSGTSILSEIERYYQYMKLDIL